MNRRMSPLSRIRAMRVMRPRGRGRGVQESSLRRALRLLPVLQARGSDAVSGALCVPPFTGGPIVIHPAAET
jgi:hypothetical protein